MSAARLRRRREAVLFDLDGTLIDSAPDLAAAANDLRQAHGLPPLPFATLRPMVGAGARGMVGVAFGAKPGDADFEGLRDAFLVRYAQRLLDQTAVFDAMHPVLRVLDQTGVRWGVVTNKASRFTEPIVDGLQLRARMAALVCGDRLTEGRHAGKWRVLVVAVLHRLSRGVEQLSRLAAVGKALAEVECTRALREGGHRREDGLARHRPPPSVTPPPGKRRSPGPASR